MCDTVVVVGDGRVLFAKNSDRDPNESQLLEWHPAGQHEDGSRVQCTWITVPQVASTHAILISRPFWMWGAEMGANECGVVIGNEAVFTNQPYAETGLTGMDLLRLTLERAMSASDGVEILAELLERHGQGGGCGHERSSFTYHNSFVLADRLGAFVLETAGRHWSVERVCAGVRSVSNGLTIPDFASRYSDRLKTTVSACRARRALTEAGAHDSILGLFGLLRSHGADRWPSYSPVNGAMAAPCMHAGGLVASSQTTASWVSELRATGSVHWATATAAPCTSLFKPVRVGQPVDLGPAPDDHFDPSTLWWRHERFHRAAMRDPDTSMTFTDERDRLEQRWVSDPPRSTTAFAAGDELLSRWTTELGEGPDRRPWWVRRYWRARDERAGLSQPVAPVGLRAST